MRVRTLWSYLSGYVIIRVKGPRLESFINAAVAKGVHLWDVERPLPDTLIARTEARGFRRVASLAARCGVRVKILAKTGGPFFLHSLVRRRTLVAGGVLFLAMLYLLASFVWFVRIEGADEVDPEEILRVAADAGLRQGVAVQTVRRTAVERTLLLEMPRLAWVAVELRGTLATIRVAERAVIDPESRRPGHVVAERAGVIQQVVVLRGEAVVEPGDTVAPGQVLISGLLPPGSAAYNERLERDELPYIRADGTVRAHVWYEGFGEADLVDREEVPTGSVSRYTEITLGERTWRIGAQPAFDVFREEIWSREAVAGWLGQRAEIKIVTAHEMRYHTVPRSEADAREQALAAAEAEIEDLLSPTAVVVDRNQEVTREGEGEAGVVRAHVTVETVEDIKRFEPIGR